MWTRRQAVLLPLAAGACATAPSGSPLDMQFTNVETPSESVHSGVSSEDGEQRLTMRLCRYPQLGLAWVWMHARVDGQFYSFIDHIAPCRTDASQVAEDRVRYSDTAAALVFERTGKVSAPTSASASGRCLARKSATSAFGRGDQHMEASIAFSPERLYSGLREVVTNHLDSKVRISKLLLLNNVKNVIYRYRYRTFWQSVSLSRIKKIIIRIRLRILPRF